MKTTQRLSSVLAILATVCSSQAVEIIAHRGASHDAPENTLAAFKLGWQQHADAVELDIWLTKDGKIAVMHDGNTKRTAGVDKALGDQTLAELRTLDAGSWKDPRWNGEKIPTLDEALTAIPKGRKLVIEIKCGPEILPELERTLKASKRKTSELVIISFKYDSVTEAKKRLPEIPAYLLVSFKQDKKTGAWSPTIEELISKAKASRLEGINVSFKGPLDAAAVRQVHAAGLKFLVWTVDDAAVARKLAADGVDALTTNRPEWLRNQLKSE